MNYNYLHPEFESKINQLIKKCRENNMICRIKETYRNESTQTEMYTKGRTDRGDICTCGQYPNNYHCWGLAVDITLIPETYDKFRNVAESLGLTWGGINREYLNPNHVEYHLLSLKELRLTYGSYEKFRQTWEPEYKEIVPIRETIIRDTETLTLISNIQKAYNMDFPKLEPLHVNGIFDDNMCNQLNKMTLINGQFYNVIKSLQLVFNKVGITMLLNGRYNDSMIETIKSFQKTNKLANTGVVNGNLFKCILAKIY